MAGAATHGFTVDFHNHLLPGADDGARDLAEAAEALRRLCADGVVELIAAVHVAALCAERPVDWHRRMEVIDAAYGELGRLVAVEFPALRLRRGAEVRLDTPKPDFRDARLRLAGGRFVLVEFAGFDVPTFGARLIRQVCEDGWVPVLAHPERYRGVGTVALAREWTAAGARLQMNHGSLAGRFGAEPRAVAAALLAEGLVSYVSSDYHARGRTWTAETIEAVRAEPAGDEVLAMLELNGRRLLQDQAPLPVPPLRDRPGVMRRLKDLFGR